MGSKLQKQITDKAFIYNAIYTINNSIFEKELLSEDDQQELYRLKDLFDEDCIDGLIEKVMAKLDNILENENDFFEVEIYFKPKKYNKEEDKFESRPIYTASLVDQIAMIVLLNTLMFKTEIENRTYEVSELSKTLPTSFYGNIPTTSGAYIG